MRATLRHLPVTARLAGGLFLAPVPAPCGAAQMNLVVSAGGASWPGLAAVLAAYPGTRLGGRLHGLPDPVRPPESDLEEMYANLAVTEVDPVKRCAHVLLGVQSGSPRVQWPHVAPFFAAPERCVRCHNSADSGTRAHGGESGGGAAPTASSHVRVSRTCGCRALANRAAVRPETRRHESVDHQRKDGFHASSRMFDPRGPRSGSCGRGLHFVEQLLQLQRNGRGISQRGLLRPLNARPGHRPSRGAGASAKQVAPCATDRAGTSPLSGRRRAGRAAGPSVSLTKSASSTTWRDLHHAANRTLAIVPSRRDLGPCGVRVVERGTAPCSRTRRRVESCLEHGLPGDGDARRPFGAHESVPGSDDRLLLSRVQAQVRRKPSRLRRQHPLRTPLLASSTPPCARRRHPPSPPYALAIFVPRLRAPNGPRGASRKDASSSEIARVHTSRLAE
jgi:hypothetical protein